MTRLQELRLPSETLTDEQVVQRVLDGDEALFELIIRRHNQRLYRAVRSILRVDTDVEDVMQQAYVNAYTHLHQFAGGARFSTWLTRIAVHEALARVRRSRLALAGEPAVDGTASRIESPELTPEEHASNEQLRQMLEHAILSLPEPYRVVLVMREVDGASTEETAAALEVSPDVVKTRLHRARKMMREALFAHSGLSSKSLFEFRAPRCDRVAANVLAQIMTIRLSRS